MQQATDINLEFSKPGGSHLKLDEYSKINSSKNTRKCRTLVKAAAKSVANSTTNSSNRKAE